MKLGSSFSVKVVAAVKRLLIFFYRRFLPGHFQVAIRVLRSLTLSCPSCNHYMYSPFNVHGNLHPVSCA